MKSFETAGKTLLAVAAVSALCVTGCDIFKSKKAAPELPAATKVAKPAAETAPVAPVAEVEKKAEITKTAQDAVKPAEAVAPTATAAATEQLQKKTEYWTAIPEVVAEIGDVKLTKEEVKASIIAQLPDGQIPEGVSQEEANQAFSMQTKMLVMLKVLDAQMTADKFAPADDAIFAFVEKQLKRAPKQQIDMLTQLLASKNKTIKDHVAEMLKQVETRNEVLRQMYLESKLQLKEVTVDEARKYYEDNKRMFTTPADPADAFRASHILVMVKKDATPEEDKAAKDKIDGIAKQLEKDATQFEKLARENSDCGSAPSGGNLGAFSKGDMVKEFQDAVEALQIGQISPVVKTQFGYHIIRRDALQAEKVMPFDSIKDRLVEMISARNAGEAARVYLTDLEGKAGVKYFIEMKSPIFGTPAAK
ncbi:MAG: peptidylprolyl isomerase [Victivallaceae bacterium]|nr:peptidylprolyl isomerase [Victivallaceae bacterium]